MQQRHCLIQNHEYSRPLLHIFASFLREIQANSIRYLFYNSLASIATEFFYRLTFLTKMFVKLIANAPLTLCLCTLLAISLTTFLLQFRLMHLRDKLHCRYCWLYKLPQFFNQTFTFDDCRFLGNNSITDITPFCFSKLSTLIQLLIIKTQSVVHKYKLPR